MIFSHSRDLGDIVYSLCAMKAAGGGELHLRDDGPQFSAHGMTPARVAAIRPLLESQTYVTKVVYPSTERGDVDFGRAAWRMSPSRSIHDWYLCEAGADPTAILKPWLHTSPGVVPLRARTVFIARSARRQNPFFPWRGIVDLIRRKRVSVFFVGTPQEHTEFVAAHGHVSYLATPTLLDLANVMWESCRCFIGNSSCPLAVAEGLKLPCIVEIDPTADRDIHLCRAQRWESSGQCLDFEGILDSLLL